MMMLFTENKPKSSIYIWIWITNMIHLITLTNKKEELLLNFKDWSLV